MTTAKKSARTQSGSGAGQDRARTIRIILGVLVALNLVAAGLILYPPGGSAETLDAELTSLRAQVTKGRATLNETRNHSVKIEKGRSAGDEFQHQYFLDRRTVYSLLVSELDADARSTGINPKGYAFAPNLIEGSDELGMVTVTANYEGSYRNLLSLVRELDRSKSLLIIESLNAAPQPNNVLTVALKINAFTREGSLALTPNPSPNVAENEAPTTPVATPVAAASGSVIAPAPPLAVPAKGATR